MSFQESIDYGLTNQQVTVIFPVSEHIVGWFNTRLYYSNVGYVLAQVLSLGFCKQKCSGTYEWNPQIPPSNMMHFMSILWNVLLTKC